MNNNRGLVKAIGRGTWLGCVLFAKPAPSSWYDLREVVLAVRGDFSLLQASRIYEYT